MRHTAIKKNPEKPARVKSPYPRTMHPFFTLLLFILEPVLALAQETKDLGAVAADAAEVGLTGIQRTFGTVLGAGILILSGLLLLFVGNRLTKPSIFFGSGYLLGGLAYTVLLNIEIRDQWVNFGIVAAAFLVGGLLGLFLYKIGLFLLGAMAGWMILLFIQALVIVEPGWVRLVVLLAAVIIGGLVTVKFESRIMAIATSIIGSAAIILGIDVFADQGVWAGVNKVLRTASHPSPDRGTVFFILVALFFALVLLGVIVQWKVKRSPK